MSHLSRFKKDYLIRSNFEVTEFKRLILKALRVNFRFRNSEFQPYFCGVYQRKFRKLFSLSAIKNICFFTGRTRSIYRTFRCTRMQLKDFASNGEFSGLRRSSW